MLCYNSGYRMTAAMLVTSGGLTRQERLPDMSDDTTTPNKQYYWYTTKKWPEESASWDELRDCLLSDEQLATFDAIVALIGKNGAYPTTAQLAEHMNIKRSQVNDRLYSLDGWVIHRTAYFEHVELDKMPRVEVHSPRLRTPEDQEHRFQIAVNRHKLSARKRSAKKRAENAVVEGSYTTQDIRDLLFMQRGRCWWCQCELEGKFHADHRMPLSRGGSNYAENICLSCPDCNMKKGDKMPWEFCGRLL